jgi:transposase-like protein
MSKRKRYTLAASATPWDGAAESTLTASQKMVAASHRSMFEFRHERFDGDIDFLNSFARSSCPICGDTDVARNGHDRAGLQRYRCAACSATFSPATGTAFESRKLPLSAWVDFLLQAFSFASISAMTREDRRSRTTVPYWIGKLFLVLDGIQDECVLSGRVQVDETYYPIPGKDAVETDGKKLRGLSRNKICIGIGCDDLGRSYYAREGFGKTSTAKTLAAFEAHIKRGSHLIHDMEKSHNGLIRKLTLEDEAYNAKLLCKLDDADNPLNDVNHLCFLLKRFLGSHSGFDRACLDGYLNLFSVMMNPPVDKLEKVELVLNRAMGNPVCLRFREFYNVKPS